MKNYSIFNFLLLTILLCSFSLDSKSSLDSISPSSSLWYSSPANNWNEALPVGNGRLGAMIYGGTNEEIIQFNEETLWTGQPHDYANKGANIYFDKIRTLLWQGKQDEAHNLANEHFMSQPFGQLSYQPFGNLMLNFEGHENAINYKRQLNLENAISSVFYEIDGTKYKREVFASNPDQVIVVQINADKNGVINFTAGLKSPHSNYSTSIEGDIITIKGNANNYPIIKGKEHIKYPDSKLTYEARLKVISDGGEIVINENTIQIRNANSATLYLVAATSFVNYNDISGDPANRCENYLANLTNKSYEGIKSSHVDDYQELFNRVKIDLGESKLSRRPTIDRIISFKEDEDPSLVALLYQFGRYLLISSSRAGSQPANLQGLWNGKLSPSWDSKYTININTEMNYWPAEITNLSELTDPLIRMVEDLTSTGQNVAKEHYNLNGWVTHHNTDLWRGAAPINNANHGIWPVGGAWLSQHVWWHYQFTGDIDFLKNRAYPILKEASRFFSEYLVKDPNNPDWLISGPSNSPEQGGLVMGPTMDHQIIRSLFSNTIEAANILGVDDDFVNVLKIKQKKIAPNQIGKYGQLQEWLEDKDNPTSQHRHISHLWGLYPGNEIHPLTTPELAEACKVTLSHRGDGGTGWSRAWKINMWARLLDGDHAFLLLKNLIVLSEMDVVSMKTNGGLYLNLFDAHPPFQIDGNFGATSGINEMLMQSHLRDESGDFIQDILPALPSSLATGKISGIIGKGGFELSIIWKKSKLVSVSIKSILGNKLNLRYDGKIISKETSKGEIYSFVLRDF